MKRINARTLSSLLLTTAMATGSFAAAFAQGDDSNARKLEGTWLFKITLQDCAQGTTLGAPFLSLLTFAHGGTVTETTSNPAFFPAQRSPGHGVWKADGHHTFRALTTAFINLNGVLVRTQTIDQTIDVETEDTAKTTSASVKFYSPDGVLQTTGCAVASAQRIELEP